MMRRAMPPEKRRGPSRRPASGARLGSAGSGRRAPAIWTASHTCSNESGRPIVMFSSMVPSNSSSRAHRQPDLAAQAVRVQSRQVVAAERDHAAGRAEHAREQVRQRRPARAVLADDVDRAPARHLQARRPGAAPVGPAGVRERDVAQRDRERSGAVGQRVHARRVGRQVGHVRQLVDGREQVEAVLQHRHQPVERAQQRQQRQLGGHELAQRELPVDDEQRRRCRAPRA